MGAVMAKQVDARQALRGGDRRSIGRANEIAEVAKTDPGVFAQLMDGMAADDPLIVMRCADAAEKASLFDPRLLAPHKPEVLQMLASAEQAELRWHIAQMVPRLSLTSAQAKKAFSRLLDYTEDRSGIVRTCAMQALHDLA